MPTQRFTIAGLDHKLRAAEHRSAALNRSCALQEIESILDNPGEMADMHLADKEAVLDAKAEQVQRVQPFMCHQLSHVSLENLNG